MVPPVQGWLVGFKNRNQPTQQYLTDYSIDRKWVGRFKDSNLKKLTQEGLASNLSLQAMYERVNQATLRPDAVRSAGLPQLGFSTNATRQRTRFLGLDIPGVEGVTYNAYNLGLNAKWELDLWGRIKAAHKAQLSATDADIWNAKAAQASLMGQVCKTYFAAIEAEQQKGLAQEALKAREQIKEAIEGRFTSALAQEGGSAAQLRMAMSDIASAKADLAQWQEQGVNTRRVLEQLIGRYPSASLKVPSTLPALVKKVPSQLPSELLRRRPDLKAAESRYMESVHKNDEAARAVFPAISLTSSAGTTSTQLKDLLKSSFGIWSLGGAVTQSILSGGAVKTEKLIRKSEAKARLVDLQDAILKACGEVEQALTSEHFIRIKLQETKEAEKLARESYEAMLDDYQQGVSDIQSVLNSEARVIQSASRLTTLSRMLLDNRVDLYLALGGDHTLHN